MKKQNGHSKPAQHIHFVSKEENNNDIYLNDSFFNITNFPLKD